VETGPQTTGVAALEACQRSFDKGAYLRGVSACKKTGITVAADLIVGLPGDTVETVLASMRFVVQDADPGILQISTLHVLPGTLFWEKAQALDLHFDTEAPHTVIQTADISYKELRELEVFGAALSALYRS
jgi:radical SAM superfamily enzyme